MERLLPTLPSLDARLFLLTRWYRFFKGLFTYLLHELVAVVLPEAAEVSTAAGMSCGISTMIRSRHKLDMLYGDWRLGEGLEQF